MPPTAMPLPLWAIGPASGPAAGHDIALHRDIPFPCNSIHGFNQLRSTQGAVVENFHASALSQRRRSVMDAAGHIVYGGHIHRNAIGALNSEGRRSCSTGSHFLLYREDKVHFIFQLLHLFQRFQQNGAPRTVIQKRCGDPVRGLHIPRHKGRRIANCDQFFCLRPAFRPKVQIEFLKLQLFSHLIIPDADRRHSAISKAYRRMEIVPDPASDPRKASKALFINSGEHQSYRIHMGGNTSFCP